jgi:DNA replication protein DnaC
MSNTPSYDRMDVYSKHLKLDMSGVELAEFAAEHKYSADQVNAVLDIMHYLDEKKHENTINTLLRLSRLPTSVPKTFETYDFTRVHGKDVAALKNLFALSEVNAGMNIAFIGPPGVGKTHLAEAYGRECCLHGMKTYFLKASELNDKFTTARKFGRESKVVASMVKPTCLIIDEIGRCTFDEENTNMFFDMVDRRYEKEGPKTMIFTSNKQPGAWEKYFTGRDDLLAALDRIFDHANVFNIKGNSYRGRACTTYAVEAGDTITE